MGLQIVGRNGRTGQVTIQDDSGIGAIFVCDEFGQGGGIAVAPDLDASSGRGKFPWLSSVAGQLFGSSVKPFDISVDISSLGHGLRRFKTSAFIARAVQAADNAEYETRLSSHTAAEWGYVDSLSADGLE